MRDRKKNLHLVSKYNPEAEADRFVNHLIQSNVISKQSIILIIGAVEDHLHLSLLKHGMDDSNLLFCFFDTAHSADFTGCSHWTFGSEMRFSNYLQMKIPMHSISRLTVVEWKPAIKEYPQITEIVTREIKIFTAKMSANIHTFGKLGRTWLRNYIINFCRTNSLIHEMKITGSCVLAIPGPSLERSIPLLREYRNRYTLIALSSAVRPLLLNGVTPDAYIQSDGGFYADRILDHCSPETLYSIKTLTSGHHYSGPTLLLRNNTPLDAFLPEEIAVSMPNIPDQGTVSSTAISYLQQIVEGRIFVCGLDLQHPVDTLHLNGHLQDYIWSISQDRLNTVFSRAISSILPSSIRQSGGLYRDLKFEQYRTHLAAETSPTDHLYRVHPSSIKLPYKEITPVDMEQYLQKTPPSKISHSILTVTREMKREFLKKMDYFADNLGQFNGMDLLYELFLYIDTQAYLLGSWNDTGSIRREFASLSGIGRGII